MNNAYSFSDVTSVLPTDLLQRRIERLQQLGDSFEFAPASLVRDPRPWVAMVSSRLGHNLTHQREVSRFLSRSMLDCRERGAVALVASQSAIEPLATRAAELFRVPILRVVVSSAGERRSASEEDSIEPAMDSLLVWSTELRKLDRDELVIRLADRLDVVSARAGGKIARYASERIQSLGDASTRVAVLNGHREVAIQLIELGGVGWLLSAPADGCDQQPAAVDKRLTTADWMNQPNVWLVHCTRGTFQPWPGETETQFRDELLLNDQAQTDRSAFQTLVRIIRGRRLLASCRTSHRRWPVVCFSEIPLGELLGQRQYRPHLHRWDYEPYGIAIRISAARRIGIREVQYGDPNERELLDLDDRFLFQARGKTFDWTLEREWRSGHSVDLDSLAVEDVRVFTKTEDEAETLRRLGPWRVDVCSSTSS